MRPMGFSPKTAPLVGCLVLAMTTGVLAGQNAQQTFERGYFLQQHERDLGAAAAAFEQVAADPAAPEPLRREAKVRLAQCREDLATADFARLMPPDAIAYLEISNPGEHVARIVQMLGLLRDPDAPPPAPAGKGTPLGEGLYFPDDFTISPALVAELKKVRGVAAAVTAIDPRGDGDGVAVIHPGDADLLRGLIETAVQCLEPAEPIEGFRTYRLQREAWLTVTARMIFVARSRDQLVGAIARLKNPEAESLATSERFQAHQADREGALAFAYVNMVPVRDMLGNQLRGDDAAIAKGVFDLEHLESFVAVLGTTDESIHVQAKLELAEGHQNLAYALVRTAPLSRRSLEHVPPGVAGLVLLGLNPAGDATGPAAEEAAPQYITAMDLGREIFGNIEEVAVFALPPSSSTAPGRPPFPEVGAVLAVKNAAKSQALWNQLLALPALFGEAPAPQDATIEETPAKVFAFPDVPPVALARANHAILVGTHSAVAAALRAGRSGNAVTSDPAFAPLLEKLTPQASKALLVHIGRAIPIAAAAVGPRDAKEMMTMADLLTDLRASVVTDEAPTRFMVRAEVAGLPNVPDLIRRWEGARRQLRSVTVESASAPAAAGP
jgi:hypothetical protein